MHRLWRSRAYVKRTCGTCFCFHTLVILLLYCYFACMCLSERVFVCVFGYAARIVASIVYRNAFVLSIPMKIAYLEPKSLKFFASGGAPQAGEARV